MAHPNYFIPIFVQAPINPYIIPSLTISHPIPPNTQNTGRERRGAAHLGTDNYFTPAKVVHAYTYDDIVRAVRDHATYPSPVRALGNIHTVTYLTVNQGGTVVLMRNLRGVKEFKFDERFGHQTVTVLSGTTALEKFT